MLHSLVLALRLLVLLGRMGMRRLGLKRWILAWDARHCVVDRILRQVLLRMRGLRPQRVLDEGRACDLGRMLPARPQAGHRGGKRVLRLRRSPGLDAEVCRVLRGEILESLGQHLLGDKAGVRLLLLLGLRPLRIPVHGSGAGAALIVIEPPAGALLILGEEELLALQHLPLLGPSSCSSLRPLFMAALVLDGMVLRALGDGRLLLARLYLLLLLGGVLPTALFEQPIGLRVLPEVGVEVEAPLVAWDDSRPSFDGGEVRPPGGPADALEGRRLPAPIVPKEQVRRWPFPDPDDPLVSVGRELLAVRPQVFDLGVADVAADLQREPKRIPERVLGLLGLFARLGGLLRLGRERVRIDREHVFVPCKGLRLLRQLGLLGLRSRPRLCLSVAGIRGLPLRGVHVCVVGSPGGPPLPMLTLPGLPLRLCEGVATLFRVAPFPWSLAVVRVLDSPGAIAEIVVVGAVARVAAEQLLGPLGQPFPDN